MQIAQLKRKLLEKKSWIPLPKAILQIIMY